MARKGRRFRSAPSRSRNELAPIVDGEGIRLNPGGGVRVSGSAIRHGLGVQPLPREVQFSEDREGPAGRGGGGEALRLSEARIGRGDDRQRSDLAVLGIEHDSGAQRPQVLVAQRFGCVGDLEILR